MVPGGSLPASLFTMRVSPPRSTWTSSLEIPSSFVLSLYPPYWSVFFVKMNLTFITLEGPTVSDWCLFGFYPACGSANIIRCPALSAVFYPTRVDGNYILAHCTDKEAEP